MPRPTTNTAAVAAITMRLVQDDVSAAAPAAASELPDADAGVSPPPPPPHGRCTVGEPDR